MKKLNISLERLKRYRYPALILAAGLLLLLIPAGRTGAAGNAASETQAAPSESFDLEGFTRQAEALLSELNGAGEVKLLLSLDTDGQWEYLMERSGQYDGEQRQAVLVRKGGDEQPVTVNRSYPRFRGAVALCSGGDSPELTLRIKEALSSLTGLGMDRITVLKSA